MASKEVLRHNREGFTADDAKDYCSSSRSAYSMANAYCGAGVDTFCGTRELFKPVWAIDNDPTAKHIYNKLTGARAYDNIEVVLQEADQSKLTLNEPNVVVSATLLTITPPCPDYSTGNPSPKGELGDNGGHLVNLIPKMVASVSPKMVFIEQVANLVNFVDVFENLLKGLHGCGMAVHAAVVRMTDYGDIENCWRLVVVAISSELGSFADNYKIPIGEFSDEVAYTAEHVATPTSEIPRRFQRWMQDYEIKPMFMIPSEVKKVAQDRQGFGYSSFPHAVYALEGKAPKCTTRGAGRHKPIGWRVGDGGNESYMFTPDDVGRHKNLPADLIELYRQSYIELGGHESLGLSEDEFLYKCMGNGFSANFGKTMYRSLHRQLEAAGVPHDIVRSEVTQRGVKHVFADRMAWNRRVRSNVAVVAAYNSRLSSPAMDSGGQDLQLSTYAMTFDTGATGTLAWDDQDRHLQGRRKSTAVVRVAKAGSHFGTTSQGFLEMAVLDTSLHKGKSAKETSKADIRDLEKLRELKHKIMIPVTTCGRGSLSKQLLGFPELFKNFKFNADLRQDDEKGQSCMWKRHPSYPDDISARVEIPLRWDAIAMEWFIFYIPVGSLGNEEKYALSFAANNDAATNRGEKNVRLQEAMDKPAVVEAFFNELIDFEGSDAQAEVRIVKADQEVQEGILDRIPEGKRLQVIMGRSAGDANERGVKQYLPSKELRSLSGDDFHKRYGHIGSGKKCAWCALIKGSMRYIFRIVDKYIETRMGYFWDMDTLTVNVRADDGTKYYTIMRDRGSKYIKAFSLQFKDHFIDNFRSWIAQMRKDKIYEVYGWDFCSIIKADNDGVWMRNSAAWQAVCEEFNIRMHYTSKDRKESNCHAEVTIGIVERVAKGIQFESGLPATDHHIFIPMAVWLLNRFPPTAALQQDSHDGDTARPIEMLTMGQVSRATINRELAVYVAPGTIIFVHDAKAIGSNFSNPRVVMRVAKAMLGHQVICFEPNTKVEMKTDSYTLVNPGQGVHWRDHLGVDYVKPHLGMAQAGDAVENLQAKAIDKLITFLLPNEVKKQLKGFRQMQKKDFIKHVTSSRVLQLNPDDIKGLVEQIEAIAAAEKENPTIEAQAEPYEGSQAQNLTPPTPCEGNEGSEGRGSEMQGVRSGDTVTVDPSQPGQVPSVSFEDPEIKRPMMTDEEREHEKCEKRSLKRKANPINASGHILQRKVGGASSAKQDDVLFFLKTDKPIGFTQKNPKLASSTSYDRYERYKMASTLNEAMARGASLADIRWDYKRGFWRTIELPTLPEAPAVASESGGQESALEDSQLAEEPVVAADGAVRTSSDSIIASTAKAADEIFAPQEDDRQREYSLAMEDHIVIQRRFSYHQVAKLAEVPQSLIGVYSKWLKIISNDELGGHNVGSIKAKGIRAVIGTKVPKPKGSIWCKMVSDHYLPKTMSKPEYQPGEEEAWLHGFCQIRAMSALTRLESSLSAHAAKVRAKDGWEGIPPPPKGIKGVYAIPDDDRRNKFIAAFVKECSDLEKMGTISHLHTREELLTKYGVDIGATPAVPTMTVFDNKFPDGNIALSNVMAKARLCVEGTPRQMQHGVHYDAVYAATPDADSIFLMNALVVHLKLFRRAFDVGNAYGWGKQDKKLALKYPRGMEQFDEHGEPLYMVLLKNTYGKPDGANLWYKERDTFWLTEFNDEEKYPGWSCRQLVMEQTLFEFTWSREVDGDLVTDTTYLLAWSDDCDMAGTSELMMEMIETACHNKWKVKQVDAEFMLGVRRTLTVLPSGEWELHLTQTEFIDGLVGIWKAELELAGFANKSPDTPIPPRTFFSANDEVDEAESKRVSDRGYKAVCGSLLWVARFCHCEIASSVSMCCRLMMKPTEVAWSACMQIVAWLRDHKHIGVKYTSNRDEHGLVVTSDASNKGDPKDSKVMASHTIQWKGGPIAHQAGKLPRIGAGSGANEFMALRIAAARLMKFRFLFKELGIMDVLASPTIIYCDSNVAINWIKTGKISKGNHYLDVDWHQPREWEREGHLITMGLDTWDMMTDLGTKACNEAEFGRHLFPMKGHALWVITKRRVTMTFT